ncbi:hypothetical protein [Paraburkholderia sp.]|jgi:hypothetical protein|uniref:hypothetical protein n=1 Tax=Paraburkholderia sp. TaxID=1926495 RepID=UPI002F417547
MIALFNAAVDAVGHGDFCRTVARPFPGARYERMAGAALGTVLTMDRHEMKWLYSDRRCAGQVPGSGFISESLLFQEILF